jgi:hypothetical protein
VPKIDGRATGGRLPSRRAARESLTIRPDRLERLCVSLPEASERETWGDPTWQMRDRIIAIRKGNDAGGRPRGDSRCPPPCDGSLIASEPDRFFVPPSVGHKG